MDIGIGLPNSLIGVEGPELVTWARKAEERGFSVLGTIGRIAYDTHEELIALAAAAGATERIDLMPTVLVAPPRQAVLESRSCYTFSEMLSRCLCAFPEKEPGQPTSKHQYQCAGWLQNA